MIKKIYLFALLAILVCSLTNAQTGNVGIGTAAPVSKLTVNGSFAGAYTPVTANTYTIGENDFSIMWNGTADGTLTLPASTSGGDRVGRLYYFKNGSSTYNITISANGSELVDNKPEITIQPGESVLLTKTNINTAMGNTYMVLQLTQSQQPYMYTITGAAAENVGEGAIVQLIFENVEYSTNGGGDFNATNSSWICPQSGWYNIETVSQVTSPNVNTHTELIILKNGIYQSSLVVFTPGLVSGSGSVSQNLNLTKGDTITISAVPCLGCGSPYTTFTRRKMNITKL